MMRSLYHTLLVAMGAACGGLLRWGVGLAFAAWVGTAFPWGTLFINVSGCLFLGWFGKWLTYRLKEPAEELRLFLAVGFCGAYTTFSSYELEASRLPFVLAALYLAGSVALGMLAVWLGVWLATGRNGDKRQASDDPQGMLE